MYTWKQGTGTGIRIGIDENDEQEYVKARGVERLRGEEET
jgi:hypothetical protein